MTTLIPKYAVINTVNRPISEKFAESVSVNDYGAVGDGTTDDTAAFQAAITAVAIAGGGKVIAPSAAYKISGTVLVPGSIYLDLCNATITGNGIGSATALFESGYLSGSTIVTTVGTVLNSHYQVSMVITNATINSTGRAFNLYNVLDNSEISNIHFGNCTYAIYASNCYYCRFINLFSRGAASAATNAAFYFYAFVNVEAIESCFVTDRTLGFDIVGGANGLKLLNCSAEGCTTGIKVTGASGPIEFDTCYFEGCSGFAVDLNTGGYKYVTFNNCWFYSNGVGIRSDASGGAELIINENNHFLLNTTNVVTTDNVNDFSLVNIPPTYIVDSGLLPNTISGYTLAGKTRVNYDAMLQSSATGLIQSRTKYYGPTTVPFQYQGDAGTGGQYGIPFSTQTIPTANPTNAVITTSIKYRINDSMLVYKLVVTDNSSTTQLYGLILGDKVHQLDAVGRTITLSSDANGNLVLTINGINNSLGGSSIAGTIRHM